MFGIAKRIALSTSRCPASSGAGAVARAKMLFLRDFHASPPVTAFRPAWMPMRVKTPWIDALTQSREQAKQGEGKAAAETTPKPDLTPRKMSDSYFSAVGRPTYAGNGDVLAD